MFRASTVPVLKSTQLGMGDVRGSADMQVAEPIRNRPGISVGSVINGNLHVTRGNMVISGAANPNCVHSCVGTI